MSIKFITKAFSVKLGNPLRKLILIKLADNANDEGLCWPSMKSIANQCDCSVDTVRRHVRSMAENGILEIHPVVDSATGVRIGTRYKLHLDAMVVADSKVGGSREQGWVVAESNPNRHIEPSVNHIPHTSLPPQGGDGRSLITSHSQQTDRAVVEKSDKRGSYFETSEYGGVVPDEWISWAISQGLPFDRAAREAEAFRDYWISASGAKARKRNWKATWRNWIRRSMERGGVTASHDDFSPEAFMRIAREAYEETEEQTHRKGVDDGE